MNRSRIMFSPDLLHVGHLVDEAADDGLLVRERELRALALAAPRGLRVRGAALLLHDAPLQLLQGAVRAGFYYLEITNPYIT